MRTKIALILVCLVVLLMSTAITRPTQVMAGTPTKSAEDKALDSVFVRVRTVEDQSLFRNSGGLSPVIHDFPAGWEAMQTSSVETSSRDHYFHYTEQLILTYTEQVEDQSDINLKFVVTCHDKNLCDVTGLDHNQPIQVPESWLVGFQTPKGQFYVDITFTGANPFDNKWVVYIAPPTNQ